MKLIKHPVNIMLTLIMLLSVFAAQAQKDTKFIGNKPREGSSNASFSVTKGQQIGVKMKAGGKPVQLLKLNFGADNRNRDSLQFKVNVYEFNNDNPGESLTTQAITGAIPAGKSRVNVDLAPYNITVKGTILVAIEWLSSHQRSDVYFHIGLFNGGTYRFENEAWKKMPVAGVDFNVQVKKLK